MMNSMKTLKSFTLILAALLLAQTASAYVEVLLEPEKAVNFRDLAFDGREGKREKQYFVKQIAKHLEKLADRELPPDSTLIIVFTQVDMAGEYEPWRSPPNDDIRIMKASYPPRLEFSYVLTGDDGAIIKKGEETLTDMAYLNNSRRMVGTSDNLFYEKELLTRWVKDHLSDI